MNKLRNSTPSKGLVIGGVSLATAFVMMCLAILSVILYSSTSDTMALAERAAEATKHYYEADLIGTEFVFTAAESLKNGDSTDTLKKDAAVSYDNGIAYITKEIFVSDDQQLCLTLKYKDGKLTVTKWALGSTEDWTADDDLGLWDGENG